MAKIDKVCYNTLMTTVNISVTDDQLKWIDKTSDKLGFANRSEFVRGLLRYAANKEEVLSEVQICPFEAAEPDSIENVVKEFTKTGKYSKAFLKDLEKGLKRSDLYK